MTLGIFLIFVASFLFWYVFIYWRTFLNTEERVFLAFLLSVLDTAVVVLLMFGLRATWLAVAHLVN